MGRSRSLETLYSSRGKVDEGRAREKGTKYSVDCTVHSLDGCLNVEESIKLHEALAQLTYTNSSARSFGSSRYGSYENLKEASSPPTSSNNLLQGTTSPVGGSLRKMTKATSQNQLFRNPQGRPMDANRMLVMVTVLGSVGPLRVLVDAEATVQTVVGAALQAYAREGRLPSLGLDSSWFDLHSGHVSFNEALEPFQPVKPMNARNFVMVKRQSQREEVVGPKQKQKNIAKTTSWLEDVWEFGTWWAKIVISASPAFLQGTDSKSAKAWLRELESPPTAVSSF